MKKILVIGGGSFGTALSVLLSEKGHYCFLWEHNEEYRKRLREDRENKNFLEGVKFNNNIEIIDDYNEKALEADMILLATPTQFIRTIIRNMIKLNKNKIIVNVAKGLEIGTLKRISQIIDEELKEKKYHYVLLAGPTHAEEIAKNMPSAIVSVCKNEEIAKEVQNTFNTDSLRVYTGTDVVGSELAGALKNCLAIVAGISDGLGYGDNTKAALMTRGINEMAIISEFFGADKKTFMGLTGFGDLVVTCTSKHSRNRFLGEELGRGKKLEDIIKAQKMVSEGATTIKALYDIIIKNNLRAPIFIELYSILYDGKSTDTITKSLMNRNLRAEF